jgi:hypothetical protein
VGEEDRHKTTFTTPWRTYAYVKIPFGMMNFGANFQSIMNHAFTDMIGKEMADYQDNLMVYSKLRQSHMKHLIEVFQRCTLYRISLNPKKFLFSIS